MPSSRPVRTRSPEILHIVLVITVVGDDADDYLGAGEDFALWRGHDIGRGVVTRRIFA